MRCACGTRMWLPSQWPSWRATSLPSSTSWSIKPWDRCSATTRTGWVGVGVLLLLFVLVCSFLLVVCSCLLVSLGFVVVCLFVLLGFVVCLFVLLGFVVVCLFVLLGFVVVCLFVLLGFVVVCLFCLVLLLVVCSWLFVFIGFVVGCLFLFICFPWFCCWLFVLVCLILLVLLLVGCSYLFVCFCCSCLLLMPPGTMSFLGFFLCRESAVGNWLFRITWRVFFIVARKFNSEMQQCFLAEFFQGYIVFLVVATFAKTDCYSPSNLPVCSATYRASATYQWSTCRKWYVTSFQAFHHLIY